MSNIMRYFRYIMAHIQILINREQLIMSKIMLDVSKVFNYLIEKSEASQVDIAKKTDIPRSTITRLLAGKTPDPRASTLFAIAQYFGISIDQLLGNQPIFTDNTNAVTGQHFLPIIDLSNAQQWEHYAQQPVTPENQQWIMADPSINNGKFAVRVTGDAMWPQFQEKALLIIDPGRKPKNRDFVIAYSQRDNDIKFRQLILDGKQGKLCPLNQLFEPVPLDDLNNVIGVVIQERFSYY